MKTRILDYAGLLELLGTPRHIPIEEVADFLVTGQDYARKVLAALRQDGYGIENQKSVGYRRNRSYDSPLIRRRERKLRRLQALSTDGVAA
jgi:biotin operon repressor